MAFWNRKKQQDRRIEVKALGSNDALSKFILYGAMSNAETPAAALQLYRDSSVVFIPINKIAEAFSTLEPVLEIDDKKVEDHPLLDLLRNPCPEFSQQLFMMSLATYYLVTNETFVLLFGNLKQPPKQLYPINPADVMHNVVNGLVGQYSITGNLFPSTYTNLGNATYVSQERLKQLVHIRGFNPSDSSIIRGRSKLVAASNAARTQILGAQHNLSLLERGGRLSLIFHFDQEMTKSDFQAVKDEVIAKFGGASNAGTIGVTAGGKLDIKEAGMTNVDMDWLNAQKLSQETLLLTYNLPLPLFSTSAATYDNYSTSLLAFYDDAVIPLSKVIFGGLAKVLFPKFGISGDAELTFDKDDVSALIERRIDEVKKRKEIGIETDNELREMIGREPYPGGDVMYKPSSEIPVGTDVLTENNDVTDTEDEDGEEE